MNNISIDRRFAVPRASVRETARVFHLPRLAADKPAPATVPLVMRWSLDPHGVNPVASWSLSGEDGDAAIPQTVRRAAAWRLAAPVRLAA